MPVRVIVTAGTTADCTQATALIDGIAAQFLLADRGYDTNELIGKALESGCEVVISPKKNRKEQRSYDKHIYRVRHLRECFSAPEEVARHCYQVCKNTRSVRCRRANTVHCSVAETFIITRVDTT